MPQWTFSASSGPYLQRFIEAASQVKTVNKWTEKFSVQTSSLRDKTDINIPESVHNSAFKDSPVCCDENQTSFSNEDCFEALENEQISLPIFSRECTKNPDLIVKAAEKLSSSAVEKLFNTIFSEVNIENEFLNTFCAIFIPNHLKFNYSFASIEILSKICEKYPELFINLLEILFNDTELDKNVLSSYLSTLNEEQLSIFIENLSKININSEGFVHNLHTVYTAYKDCIKNDKTQDFIKKSLINHSQSCETDKNYGRLFLLYLQNEKNMSRTIEPILETCLETHKSAFKKPCLNLIQELSGE